jgi:hypothetical protein
MGLVGIQVALLVVDEEQTKPGNINFRVMIMNTI